MKHSTLQHSGGLPVGYIEEVVCHQVMEWGRFTSKVSYLVGWFCGFWDFEEVFWTSKYWILKLELSKINPKSDLKKQI